MMTMGQLVLGVTARARERIEVRVGCTKRTEVAGGVRTPVRPSYTTSGKPRGGHLKPRGHLKPGLIYLDLRSTLTIRSIVMKPPLSQLQAHAVM